MRKSFFIMLLGIPLGIVSPARAALIDRGGGLIYDHDLDITWLQTPSNVKRWTANKDGVTNIWTYAGNFSYYDTVRDKTWDDWRLPSGNPATGTNAYSNAGELGHLFYDELHGVARLGLVNGQAPFTDLQDTTYWTSTVASTANKMTSYAILDFDTGKWKMDCGMVTMSDGNYVLLVRDGDVGPAVAGNGNTDFADSAKALRMITGTLPPAQPDTNPADVNGDNRIGMEEVIYLMQKVAEQR